MRFPGAIKVFAREICRNDLLNFGRLHFFFPDSRLALDLSTDKTLKEARFDRHFVRVRRKTNRHQGQQYLTSSTLQGVKGLAIGSTHLAFSGCHGLKGGDAACCINDALCCREQTLTSWTAFMITVSCGVMKGAVCLGCVLR